MSITRLPAALSESTSPGGTTVVDSRSSTSAGPSMRWAAVRA
jgi:hypothetical protein